MKIDFSQTVNDIFGEPMMLPPKKGATEPAAATLGDLCVQALLADFPGEQLTGEEKYKRYEIASAIKKGAEGISIEDLAILKPVIGKGYGAAVVGPVYDLLEGK